MTDELERIWEEAAFTDRGAVQSLTCTNDEPQSRQMLSQPRFDVETSPVQV
jgi:hypothetical protein